MGRQPEGANPYVATAPTLGHPRVHTQAADFTNSGAGQHLPASSDSLGLGGDQLVAEADGAAQQGEEAKILEGAPHPLGRIASAVPGEVGEAAGQIDTAGHGARDRVLDRA